jgi:hypothetical protein
MDQRELAQRLQAAVTEGASVRGAAKALGVSHGSARYALAKIKDKVRTAAEFRGLPEFTAPRNQQTSTCWSLEQIRQARDAQLRGDFKLPVALAKVMGTDDAIFTARRNRAAPQSCLSTRLVPANGARGERVAAKALRSVHASRKTLRTISTTLADHGIAIGYNDHEPSEDGSRVDFRVKHWPLEHVKWNESTRQLETRIDGGGPVEPIIHGNGRWTIFAGHEEDPWAHDAAILPAAFVWGIHANGLTDWAAGSLSHGSAKVFGELPSGVALLSSDGTLTAEANAFLLMMQQIMSGGSPAGIRPAGSKTDVLTNSSTQHQVFSELVGSREKAAARIYLGTDAILGSVGGAPGVDIAVLFAMATTIIQGDLEVLEACLRTGVYEPWCAINEGSSAYAPTLRYNQPDPDAEAKAKEIAAGRDRLTLAIKGLKDSGMVVDQTTVNKMAADFNVHPAPLLASGDTKAVPIPLAPTDIAKIVRVGPALRSIGLEPFGDERDNMTITELDEANKAKAAVDQAQGEATAAPPPEERAKLAALSRFSSALA